MRKLHSLHITLWFFPVYLRCSPFSNNNNYLLLQDIWNLVQLKAFYAILANSYTARDTLMNLKTVPLWTLFIYNPPEFINRPDFYFTYYLFLEESEGISHDLGYGMEYAGSPYKEEIRHNLDGKYLSNLTI